MYEVRTKVLFMLVLAWYGTQLNKIYINLYLFLIVLASVAWYRNKIIKSHYFLPVVVD
jgi:hypothetical protein